MIFILSSTTRKAFKNTLQATTFKVEENSRTFQGLARKFKASPRKNGIQGLFKDFPLNSRTFQGCVNPVERKIYITVLQYMKGLIKNQKASHMHEEHDCNITSIPLP